MRKPFFMKKLNAWYVWYQGKQIRLDVDKAKAFQMFHEMMAREAPAQTSDSVASLCNLYLEWCEKKRAPRTYESFCYYLSSFVRSIGTKLRIRDLKPMHITNWLSDTNWNETTQSTGVRYVKRVFNWARKEGRLDFNPIREVESPTPKRREHATTSEQHELTLSLVSDESFRDYLTFLSETGARPQEAKIVEASHCQLDLNRIVLPPSNAKGKEDYRVIYLTLASRALVERLCRKFPDGPILRTTTGTAWTKNSVNCRFSRLKKRLKKMGKKIEGLCATSWRHGFATEALKNGVDPVTVSVLMGHKDTTMVSRVYQHLAADSSYLTKSLARAKGGERNEGE